MKPGQLVRHKPTGREARIKWVSPHPDVTFVYLDLGDSYAQVLARDCEPLEAEEGSTSDG